MPLSAGLHSFGPHNGELLVHTRRSGAAAKAGHDLVLEVTSWSGQLQIAEDGGETAVALTAAGDSIRVREGRGGMQALDEHDKAGIKQTVDEEILKRSTIEFRSTAVDLGEAGEAVKVRGELEILGRSKPLQFELKVDENEGRLTGSATVKQTDWGITPYTTLFGALKVRDEVVVTVAADISDQSR